MAKYSGSKGTAAGDALTVLDAILVENSNWSIFDDSVGTNQKTYRCNDVAREIDFYVHIDNNYANYMKVQVWESWNATSHVGSGAYTAQEYFLNGGAAYDLLLRDYNFIWVDNRGADNRLAYYVGGLTPVVHGMNIIILAGHTGTAATTSCPLCLVDNSSVTIRAMRSIGGAYDQEVDACLYGITTPVGTSRRYIFDTNGYAHIQEEYMTCGGLCIGRLDGVMMTYLTSQGLADGDTIDVDGVEWEVYVPGGSYTIIMRND